MNQPRLAAEIILQTNGVIFIGGFQRIGMAPDLGHNAPLT
jgi:hypothetical protein